MSYFALLYLIFIFDSLIIAVSIINDCHSLIMLTTPLLNVHALLLRESKLKYGGVKKCFGSLKALICS